MVTKHRLLLVGCIPALLALLSSQAAPPPSELAATGWPTAKMVFPAKSFRGDVQYDLDGKSVQIKWLHGPSKAVLIQTVATSFWPTSVSASRDRTGIIVAGKRRNGHTVIERWTFIAPLTQSTPPDPHGGGGGGSGPSVSLEPAVIADITTLYDKLEIGKNLALHVIEKPDGKYLVQFWDSRDVYELDASGPVSILQLVASPLGPAPFIVSELNSWFAKAVSGERTTEGYVYIFLGDEAEVVTNVVLADTDKNGSIDSTLVFVGDQWITSGWSDGSSYVNLSSR